MTTPEKLIVHEIFQSIQGEGLYTGRLTTFIRLYGCNRHCPFCDTKQAAFRSMTTGEIIEVVKRLYTGTVVITGGEPLTQPLMALLCQLLHLNPDILIGIETNGTQPISDLKILGSSLTLSISPKVKRRRMAIDENDLMAFRGVSLKILYPWYNDVTAQEFLTYPAVWKGIQPITKSDGLYSTAVVTDVLYHLPSEWRLSMQLHKLLNIR